MKFYAIVIMIFILAFYTNAYDMNPLKNSTVHQHLTNESKLVWNLISSDTKDHLSQPIDDLEINGQYNPEFGDDIITASGEEDRPFTNSITHFWEPDSPNTPSISGNDDYNDGLLGFDSSYRKAMNYWITKVIPLYLKGDIDQSYYYFGRVAHLLEDASQPSHIHNDPHLGHNLGGAACFLEGTSDCDDSILRINKEEIL